MKTLWLAGVCWMAATWSQPMAATNAAPKVAACCDASKETPYVNSLGMKFVPVPGTKVLFSIWETRVQDYAVYAAATNSVDATWKVSMDGDRPLTTAPDCPVVFVSWDDANAFCAWLTEKERREGTLKGDQRYRLPTDAEWSIAVGLKDEPGNSPKEKDGKIKSYPWGDAWPPPKGAGNYADDSLKEALSRNRTIENYRDGFPFTAPVGSFPANPFGLFDIGGNVWEWVEDEYIPGEGKRTVRGGSWSSPQESNLRSSLRGVGPTDSRAPFSGFRCVLVPGATATP